MCEFCGLYGQDGDLWYLNPDNYGRQLYRRPKPGEKYVPEGIAYRQVRESLFMEMGSARFNEPEKVPQLITRINELYRANEPCQVVPLKDCLKIMDLSLPIASMSCICRRVTRATDERSPEEYSCLGLGVGMMKWERWPERYRGGVNFMSPEESKEWLIKWDKKGMMHCIMVYGIEGGNPFVGGICNCDYPDCIPLRHRLDYGITYNLVKAHYVAISDYDKCNGCGLCAQRCQFGAIKMEVTINKPNIDIKRCFGCGLCETGCKKGAIELVWREDLPGLKEEW
jgi:Pyruvate/2-oxoacid:ferredoxin oxidoreductase delta subunit